MSPPSWKATKRNLQRGEIGDVAARSTYQRLPLADSGPVPAEPVGPAPDQEANDIAAWLLHPENEQQALWVLSKVKSEKPSLITSATLLLPTRSGTRTFAFADSTPQNSLAKLPSNIVSPYPNVDDSLPVVMLADDIFIVQEEQGIVDVTVLRVGDTNTRTAFYFETTDGSAKAGMAYVGQQGRLVFEPGESLKVIEITLIPNELWDTILEFHVCLSAEDIENGVVDPYMCEACIKIFNDDPFPTNSYRQLLMDGKSELVPKLMLVKSYIFTNLRNPVVRRRSLQIMASEQVHNVIYLVGLIVNVYMLDYVLDLHVNRDALFMRSHHGSMSVIVALKLVPFIVMHFVDYNIPGMAGASMGTIQSSLVRLYMYCTDSCRSNLGYTGLLVAITEDAETVAKDVYNTSLCAFKHLGKIMMMLIFQFLSSWLFEKPLHIFPFVVMFGFPVLIAGFLFVRHEITSETQMAYSRIHVALCRQVDQICSNFLLITAFGKHAIVEAELENKIKERNMALGVAAKVGFNNHAFAQWVSTFVIAIYMVWGGYMVIDGHITVGYFVTVINIFAHLGDVWASLYADLATIQKGVPALTRISNFLNMPVDLPEIEEVKERGKLVEHGVNVDDLPIEVKGLQAYLTKQPSSAKPLFLNQGELIAITSPRSSGKTTLLKLIGGVLLPPTGDDIYLVMPTHLRVLFVGQEALFFRGTLASNLIFGCGEDDPDGNLDRLLYICKKLGLGGHVLERVEDNTASVNWAAELSESTLHLLKLVRSLMSSPDVLCVEKPTASLDDTSVDRVLGILREFVRKKGIKCSFPEKCRRPRTLIFTTERLKAAEFADTCVNVNKQGIASTVPRGDITASMLV